MVVGGVVVGCGKNLKLNLPLTKDIKVLKKNRNTFIVEFKVESEVKIVKCDKLLLTNLINNDIIINKWYTVNRMKFINTIIF